MNGLNESGTAGQREAIEQLQWDLNMCYGQGLAQDGKYGPRTRNAVMNVQRIFGLTVDGWAGPKTRGAMKHVAIEETFCVNTLHNPVWQEDIRDPHI